MTIIKPYCRICFA